MEIVTISQWNGRINIQNYIEKEIQGIYIKIDPFFYYHLDALTVNEKVRRKFKLGYQYSLTARTKTEAEKEAFYFYRQISDLSYELPPSVEVSDIQNLSVREQGLLKKSFLKFFHELSKETVVFLECEQDLQQIVANDERKYLLSSNRKKKPMDRMEFVDYTAKSGDRVSSIAKLYHVRSKDIFRVNKDLKTDYLNCGRALRIPIDSSRTLCDRFFLYAVMAGDTMEYISEKFGVTEGEVEQLNGMKEPYVLCPGQIMKIH